MREVEKSLHIRHIGMNPTINCIAVLGIVKPWLHHCMHLLLTLSLSLWLSKSSALFTVTSLVSAIATLSVTFRKSCIHFLNRHYNLVAGKLKWLSSLLALRARFSSLLCVSSLTLWMVGYTSSLYACHLPSSACTSVVSTCHSIRCGLAWPGGPQDQQTQLHNQSQLNIPSTPTF